MTNPRPFGPANRFIDVGHSRIPYFRVGRGPDVVFVHGWPLYSATFRDIVPRLADRFTCHLVDLPGTGDSEWGPASKISLRDHAVSLRRVVDQLGLTRYGLLAHDSGAVIARLLAADDARVTGLALGNSEIPGYHPWQLQLYMLFERLPLGPFLFGSGLRLRALRRASFSYGGCFDDLDLIEGDFRELFIDPMLESARTMLGQRRILQGFDWRVIDGLAEAHARIRAPVKLIWGARDPFFPLERLRPTLGQYAGGATVSLLERGKLFAHEEFPDAFAREAGAFLGASQDEPRTAAVLS